MKHFHAFATAPAALLLLGAPALAGTEYQITISGVVEFNGITSGPLGQVNPGEAASLTFKVDASNFIDSPSFPTRGYVIDKASWLLSFESGSSGLANPFPGPDPLFVIRDNDPAVDGFFVSTNVNVPQGVPLPVPGIFGPFEHSFLVTYGGDELSSLDIAGAVGFYDFTGLTVFNWTIDDGPFNPFGLLFEDMKITEIAPGSTTLYGCGVNPAGSMSVAGGSPAIGDTLELGLDNPLGTQAAGSLTVLALAVAPDAAFPCGLGVPGLGMAGAGAVGELLVDFSIPGLLLNGPAWAGPGSPAVFQLPIPCNPLLVGSTVYAQGAIVDPVAAQGVTVGLTDAVEILLGS